MLAALQIARLYRIGHCFPHRFWMGGQGGERLDREERRPAGWTFAENDRGRTIGKEERKGFLRCECGRNVFSQSQSLIEGPISAGNSILPSCSERDPGMLVLRASKISCRQLLLRCYLACYISNRFVGFARPWTDIRSHAASFAGERTSTFLPPPLPMTNASRRRLLWASRVSPIQS